MSGKRQVESSVRLEQNLFCFGLHHWSVPPFTIFVKPILLPAYFVYSQGLDSALLTGQEESTTDHWPLQIRIFTFAMHEVRGSHVNGDAIIGIFTLKQLY